MSRGSGAGCCLRRRCDRFIGAMAMADDVETFDPVENEAPLRWWRRLHLAGAGDLGARRRAVLFALACWVPIAVWALANGRLLAVGSARG